MERHSLTNGQVRPQIRAHEYAAAMSYLTSSPSAEIIILRGETGSGKSVLLNRLAHDASRLGFAAISPAAFLQQPRDGREVNIGAVHSRRLLIVADDADCLDRDEQLQLLDRMIRYESVDGVCMILTSTASTEFDRAATIIDLAPLGSDHARDLLLGLPAPVSTTMINHWIETASGNLALLCQRIGEPGNNPVQKAQLFSAGCERLPSRYAYLTQEFLRLDWSHQVTLLQLAHALALPEPYVSRGVSEFDDTAKAAMDTFITRDQVGATRFRSAIHRTAVMLAASPAQHVDTHNSLSHTSDAHPIARTLHAAAAGVDDPGALELAAGALTESSQPVWAVAAHMLLIERAPQAKKASLRRRMLGLAWSLGDIRFVSEIGDLLDSDYTDRVDPCIARSFTHAMVHGEIDRAHASVESELRRPGLSASAATEALAMLAFACLLKEDDEWWMAWRDQAEGQDVLEPATRGLLHEIQASTNGVVADHDDTGDRSHPTATTRLLSVIGSVVRANRESVPDVGPLTAAARDSGIAGVVAETYLAELLIQKNQWTAALDAAQRAHVSAGEKGLRLLGLRARSTRALASALLGDLQTARSDAHAALADPLARQMPHTANSAVQATALCFLSAGDAIEALAVLNEQDFRTGRIINGAYEASSIDFIDAASLLNRKPQQVGRVPDPGAHKCNSSLRAEFIVQCARALEQRDEHTLEVFIQESRGTPFVFERARVRLIYGELLRDRRLIPEAKLHLLAAAADFEHLGARRWRERAVQGLRPLPSDAVTRSASATLAQLTEQEERIAALAAAGLSNKEIGSQLYLSPRTVGGHLYNIFPKLGIRSRAALRDALESISLGDQVSSKVSS